MAFDEFGRIHLVAKGVPVDPVLAATRAALTEVGYRRTDASLGAEMLVEANLRGIDTHGVATTLPHHIQEAIDGTIHVDGVPRTVQDTGALRSIDGDHAVGPASIRLARHLLLDGVHELGACAVVIRNCGYLGAIGVVLEWIAGNELLGLLMVNSEPRVAPFNGLTPLHGTNPIAFIAPGPQGPILFDTRTNALRKADVWNSTRSGAPLPGNSAIIDGRPLSDVRRVDEAVLLPLAGPKGYGLALMVDLLTAGLTGSPIGREINASPTTASAFVLTLDPSRTDEGRYAETVRRLVHQVEDTPSTDPDQLVRLPGERARAERARRIEGGIPVDERWRRLPNVLRELGIDGAASAFEAALLGVPSRHPACDDV